MLKVCRDDREFGQRVRPEPRPEIRLNRHHARLAHLGNLAIDADDSFCGLHVLRFEPEDFTCAETGPDAGEQAQGCSGRLPRLRFQFAVVAPAILTPKFTIGAFYRRHVPSRT